MNRELVIFSFSFFLISIIILLLVVVLLVLSLCSSALCSDGFWMLPHCWMAVKWQVGPSSNLTNPHCPQITRHSSKCIWFGRCDLILPMWVDMARPHSQHAFQQVCLPALAWLLKSHSCGDRSQAAHSGGQSFPPSGRCSLLNFGPHNQHFLSSLTTGAMKWERTCFNVKAALVWLKSLSESNSVHDISHNLEQVSTFCTFLLKYNRNISLFRHFNEVQV